MVCTAMHWGATQPPDAPLSRHAECSPHAGVWRVLPGEPAVQRCLHYGYSQQALEAAEGCWGLPCSQVHYNYNYHYKI